MSTFFLEKTKKYPGFSAPLPTHHNIWLFFFREPQLQFFLPYFMVAPLDRSRPPRYTVQVSFKRPGGRKFLPDGSPQASRGRCEPGADRKKGRCRATRRNAAPPRAACMADRELPLSAHEVGAQAPIEVVPRIQCVCSSSKEDQAHFYEEGD